MGLIREPKEINFNTRSKPWTEIELKDFRKIMNALKTKAKRNYLGKKKLVKV